MLIKDLLVLGRSCPEPLKDGRITVCLAGYSEEHGFIRLYPTRYDTACRQWDVIKVEVEKNERDSRQESWKIKGSKAEWEQLASKIEVVGRLESRTERRNFAIQHCDPSVTSINNALRSLGIVKPEVLKTYFEENPRYAQLFQQAIPGFTELDQIKTKRDFEFMPYVVYRCPQDETNKTKEHRHQVLEWGFYEWQRKNPDKKEQVWENAGFNNPKEEIYFVVGNQLKYRNNFMVISIIRTPRQESDQMRLI